jgi:hypothetical protein
MSFTRRWNPKPKGPQCKQCNKRDAIRGRPDGLCSNCAHYPDKAKAERAKRVAAAK